MWSVWVNFNLLFLIMLSSIKILFAPEWARPRRFISDVRLILGNKHCYLSLNVPKSEFRRISISQRILWKIMIKKTNKKLVLDIMIFLKKTTSLLHELGVTTKQMTTKQNHFFQKPMKISLKFKNNTSEKLCVMSKKEYLIRIQQGSSYRSS